VKYLLDTHALLWFDWGHASLSSKAENIIASPENELLVSTASLWEIAIKVGNRKLQLAEPYRTYVDRVIAENDLEILTISLDHLERLTALPLHHRDPFDRLLAAQAIVEQVPILSVDSAFDAYLTTRLWD
jgi:PIN domain nuclease of toxin-antitoxin system